MKKSIQIIATALVMLFGNSAISQNDTMYVWKDGIVINKQSVNPSDVDSVTFYKSNQTAITDPDGNVYTSVTIGTQEWMSENLRTTKYSDGTAIPNVTSNSDWESLSTGAWCNYDNSSQYEAMYGKLYNWYAVETGKLCPTGWHVPTDAEWTVLTDYLTANGHSGAEGTTLKSTSGWNYDGNGTDDYGFLGLPGGGRYDDGYFYDVGNYGSWWSSSQYSTGNAWSRNLGDDYDYVSRGPNYKFYGFSVRCLRD